MNDTPQGSEQPDPQDTTPPAPTPPPTPATPPRYAPPQYVQPPAPTTPPQHWQTPQGYPAQPPAPQYPAPQYPAPQYAAPQNAAPQYAQQPGYGQQYAAPQYVDWPTPGPGEPFDGAASPEDLSRPLYGANIGQAFTRFFKNYAVFSGRASRSEYWWTVLLFWGAWIVTGTLVGIVEDASYSFSRGSFGGLGAISTLLGMLVTVIFLGVIIPFLAITWRRLHDANLAGPFFLLTFIPIFGQIALIALLALPPKVAGRRFYRSV